MSQHNENLSLTSLIIVLSQWAIFYLMIHRPRSQSHGSTHFNNVASKVILIYSRLVEGERHRKEHALLNPFVLDVKHVTSAYNSLDKISHVTLPCSSYQSAVSIFFIEGTAQSLMSCFYIF